MSGYAPNLLALPFALTAIAVIAAGLAIGARERYSRVGLLHLLLCGAICFWQAAMGLAYLAQSAAVSESWFRLSTYFALLIAPLNFHFGCVVTGQLHRHYRAVGGVWVATLILAASHAMGSLYAGFHHYSWGLYPRYDPAGWMFIVLTVVTLNFNLLMYWRLYRGNRPGSIAARRGLLLAGSLAIGSIAAIDFLPTLGIGVLPLGGFAVVTGIAINAYTTSRYRLVEITPAYAADQLMDTMSDGVLMIDRDGVVRLANPAAAELLGIDRSLLVDRLPPAAFARDVLGWVQLPFFPSSDMALGERACVTPDGAHRMLDVGVALLREHDLDPVVAVVTLRDITAAVQAQEQIERLAYYDPLTHLPNRLLLRDRFDDALARARRADALAAVLFMDLDRFKQVNDTLGHDAGDMLLKAVADRISSCVRETDWLLRTPDPNGGNMLARLGGDEFVLLLSPLERAQDAAKVASRILDALARPVTLKRGAEVVTGITIGISIYPSDGEDAETLLKKADVAMYRAKECGRHMFRFSDDAMNASALARTDLENSLRRGLTRSEFLLCYQPQIACGSGEIAGLDVQLYWRHPQQGMMSAAEFVAASEDTSVVLPLTEWMLRGACMQLRAWAAAGIPPLYLSLSLPAAAAERGDLPRMTREALAHAGVDPGLLMVGLRGVPGARTHERIGEAMQALQAMGMRLMLDELAIAGGTLCRAIQYPLGMVRLESALLRSLACDGDLGAVTRALIGLIHALNLGVAVTGVDTPAQAAFLREVGCDLAQGDAFGPPVAAEQVPALLNGLRRGQLAAV
jgi:diguanylate cyclase (GGDEF)-like protein/PAS domain S-box-containing protein